MVLLPKGKEGYRGIGIVEVLWKLCSGVVTFRMKRSVMLHDALRGFREGRWVGTSMMEANLEHHMEGLVHNPLFQVSLDVKKS